MNRNLLGDDINRICNLSIIIISIWSSTVNNLRFISANIYSHHYFECKPSVTHALDVEEEEMCICFLFVNKPIGCFVSGIDGYIFNHWHSHIGMGF